MKPFPTTAFLLAALAVAGCSGSPTAEPVAGTARFPQTGAAAIEASEVVWTFWVDNPGPGPSAPARLVLDVDFAQGILEEGREAEVPVLERGEPPEAFRFRTGYYGTGHYNATAMLLVDGQEVAREHVAFERCPAIPATIQPSSTVSCAGAP